MQYYIHELEVGELYTTQKCRFDNIELYQELHAYGDETDLESVYDSLLKPHECFVLLEAIQLYKTYYCLKILTQRGIVGWTTQLHVDKAFNPVVFVKPVPDGKE